MRQARVCLFTCRLLGRPAAFWHGGFSACRDRLLRRCNCFRGSLPSLLTEAAAFGEHRPLRSIVGRNHGVIGREPPLCTILLSRQSQLPEMTLERLILLAVFEANQEVRGDGPADRNSRLWLFGLRLLRSS